MRRPALVVYRVGPRSPFLVSGNSKADSCRCLPSGGFSRKTGGRKPPRSGAPSSGECPLVAKKSFRPSVFQGASCGRTAWRKAMPRFARSAAASCRLRQRTLRRVLEYLPQSTRVLCGKYDSASRKALPEFPLHKRHVEARNRWNGRAENKSRKKTASFPSCWVLLPVKSGFLFDVAHLYQVFSNLHGVQRGAFF